MLKFCFDRKNVDIFKILFLGAHSDDIEIGCGGTILRLVEENPHLSINWVVFSALSERADEACRSAEAFLDRVNQKNIEIKSFRDGFFSYQGKEIKEYFEEIKGTISPDLIFTHYRQDLHQDHRMIGELTWNTFRDHLILEYEIPKFDGDLGTPNFFINLDEDTCQRKVDHILKHFISQKDKYWFSKDIFLSLSRIRGMESRSPGDFAEGFYCRKVLM